MFDNYNQNNKNDFNSNGNQKKNINLLPDSQQLKPDKSKVKVKPAVPKDEPMHLPSARSKTDIDQPTSWLAKIKQLVSRNSASGTKKKMTVQAINQVTAQPLGQVKANKNPVNYSSQKITTPKKQPRSSSVIPKTLNQSDLGDNSSLIQKSSDQPQIKLHQIKEKQNISEQTDLEVNLLPAQKRHFTQSQILFTYLILIVILSLSTIMPYINYLTQNRNLSLQIKNLQAQVKLSEVKNKEISQQALEIKPFWLKIQILRNLLGDHIYWSEFFKLLERHTAANVYFTSLSVSSSNNSINLIGKALRLRDVAEQLIIFQSNPTFQNTVLDNLNILEAETELDPKFEFSISFNLDSQVIKKDSQANPNQK